MYEYQPQLQYVLFAGGKRRRQYVSVLGQLRQLLGEQLWRLDAEAHPRDLAEMTQSIHILSLEIREQKAALSR